MEYAEGDVAAIQVGGMVKDWNYIDSWGGSGYSLPKEFAPNSEVREADEPRIGNYYLAATRTQLPIMVDSSKGIN